MIARNEAVVLVEKYLKKRNREFLRISSAESIGFKKEAEILYGNRAGELTDQYFVEYTIQWGLDEEGELVYLDANSGEILFSLNSTNWIEEIEDENENE